MAIPDADRCPRCGSMYTGSLLPGEDPDNRYCYTCEMQAGSQDMAGRLQAEPSNGGGDDELSLQLLDTDATAGKRRPGRMAPGGRPVNRKPLAPRPLGRIAPPKIPAAGSRAAILAVQPRPEPVEAPQAEMQMDVEPPELPAPTSSVTLPPVPRKGSSVVLPAVKRSSVRMPAVKPGSNVNMAAVQRGSNASMPAVKKGSNVNMPAVRKTSGVNMTPAQRGSNSSMPAVSRGSAANIPAGRRGSSANIPVDQIAGSGRSSARHKAAAVSKNKQYITYGVAGVVGLVVLIVLFKGGKSKPEVSEVAANGSATKTESPPRESKLLTVEEALKKAQEAAAREPAKVEAPKPDATKAEAPKAEPPKPEAAAPAEPAKPETAGAATVPPEEKAAEKPATDVAELLNLNAPKRSAKVNLGDDEEAADAAPKPAQKRAAPAAPTPGNAGPGNAQGGNAEGEKKPDAMVGLGLKKAEPEKPAFDPKAPPPPVTVKEPTIVPLDLTKVDQTRETQFSQSLKDLPGWRVRDINVDNSTANMSEHRGKRDVIALNPLNDVVTSKLYATIEIPANFASKRPVLLYEMSTKDATHDWFLTVKVMNVEMIKKQKIVAKDFAWIDGGVDLSPLAGKRFEIYLEANIPKQKDTKKYKDFVAYFRNVRLEWSGKPKSR